MQLDHIDFRTLIANAKQSEDGFAQFLRSIQPYILSKARYLLESDQEAEDIFQNVSLRLYRNLDNLNPDYFMLYLKNTVTNACIDVTRKANIKLEDDQPVEMIDIDAYDHFEIPDENYSGIDLTDEYRKKIVKEIIDTLPENQKQVIVLRYMDELKIKDIAEQLNVNENTVKSRLNLAYKKIKEEVLKVQERDDIKLYSYSPFVFFLLLLRKNETSPDNYMIHKVIRQLSNNKAPAAEIARKVITAGGDIATATGNVAATTSAAGVTAKVVTGVLAGTLVVGGVGYGVSTLINNNSSSQKENYIVITPDDNIQDIENDNDTKEDQQQQNVQQQQTQTTPVETDGSDKVIGSIMLSASAGKVNIREGSSTSSRKVGFIDDRRHNVYEIKENEGYTWYRISPKEHAERWVANNGDWFNFSNEIVELQNDFIFLSNTVVSNKGSRKIGPYIMSYGKYYFDDWYWGGDEFGCCLYGDTFKGAYMEFKDDRTVHVYSPNDNIDGDYTYTVNYYDPAQIASCEASCYIKSPNNGYITIDLPPSASIDIFELTDHNYLGNQWIGLMYAPEPGQYSSIYSD